MNKPAGYDEVQVYESQEALPKGGYICQIVKLEETKSRNGDDMIAVYLDIYEGEYKGYFTQRYKAQQDPTKAKWKCIYWTLVSDTTTKQASRSFKGFISAVEKSNVGFVINDAWGKDFAKFFKGRLVGVVFGHEYFIGDNGKPAHWAKPRYIRSTESIKKGEFKIPEDDKSRLDSLRNTQNLFDSLTPVVGDEFNEDDLPF